MGCLICNLATYKVLKSAKLYPKHLNLADYNLFKSAKLGIFVLNWSHE